VLFDGLTKNWRYPGWRTTWTIGPRSVIDAVASAGSFLDGGGSRPLQRAAVALLEDGAVVQETLAIQRAFREKRDKLLSGLQRLGVRVDRVPDGTFYVWGHIDQLPAPLNDGMGFFRAALEKKVIVVPGVLRREPGQAAQLTGLPVSPARAVQLRPVDGRAGYRPRAARSAGDRSDAVRPWAGLRPVERRRGSRGPAPGGSAPPPRGPAGSTR
jgi:hypothetical protein